ncbi:MULTISPECIES: hypothetical protein, partial [unclassified Bartonella]|uniref:hypothetical protein n=1 Tax=unclassified Bartonella TaxID=2645622 RepID=UPI0035D04B19
MKKIYAIQTEMSNLKNFRSPHSFSLVKSVSFAAMVAFLSNVSPVVSANPDFRNTFVEGLKSADVSYLKSIISVAGLNTSDDYANFLTKTLSDKSDKSSVVNVLTENGGFARVGNVGHKKAPQLTRIAVNDISTKRTLLPVDDDYNGDVGSSSVRDTTKNNTMLNTRAMPIAERIGVLPRNNENILIGKSPDVKGSNIIAIGNGMQTHSKNSLYESAIGIGNYVHFYAPATTVIGDRAQVKEYGSVALGSGSVADVAKDVAGFNPLLKKVATDTDFTWRSTLGAVSVGDAGNKKTRQITGVAAGTNGTDVVNVAQLQSLQSYVDQGWNLSVGGANATTVGIKSKVDLSAASTNLTITKGDKDNNIKFDLAKEIAVNKVTAGSSTLDATGLVISGGPKIVTGGIDAGSKKITGVETGTESTDAVNFGQLKEIKEQVATSSNFVKQDSATKHITIGKDTDGDKIDISNNKNEKRTLTGINDGALSTDSNEAVTGSQLFTTNQKVTTVATNIAKSFGGDAKYEDGTWTNPTFKIKSVNSDGKEKDETYHNVADALAGVGSSITNVQNKLTEQVTNVITKVESESFVQQEEMHRLTIGAKTEGSEINIANKSGEARTLSGVGEAKNNNDAVNKGQLDTNIETINNNITNKFDTLTQNITNITQQVKGDSLLWSETDTAFVATHGEKKENSKITSLQNGDITKDSTDAVNGSQLYTLGSSVAKSLGGEAEYENGKWTAPTFTVKTVKDDGNSEETKYKTVAEALTGVGSSITNVKNEVTKEITSAITNVKGDSLVKQEADTNRITIGKEVEGTKIDITNKDGNNRTLSGVAAGTADTDAVNFLQLQKVEKDVKEQVAASSFVKQDLTTEHISIGKDTGGDKIDIANNKDEKRTLTGIKGGALLEDSNEAVIGSQLFTTNQNVTTVATNIAKSFGGGAKYEKGEWVAPTFKLKTVNSDGSVGEEKIFNSVADAFAGIASSITNVHNDVTNVVSDNLVKQDEDTKVIKIGAEKEGAEISFTNSKNELRTLSGVAAATKNNEAVNKGQLDESLEKLSNSFQSDDSAVVHYDKEEGDNSAINYTSVTLGGKDKKPVGLHNIADGVISESSHDAVNGGQINTISKNVTKFLGGNATFNNGVFTNPTYSLSEIDKDGKITDKPFTDVGSAFEGLDTNIKNVNTRIKEVSEGVAQDSLLWNKEANAFVARHEKRKEEKDGAVATPENSKITFLANGDITATSSDAIAGNQLHSFGSSVASYFGGNASYTEGKWTAPSFTIKKFDTEGTETEEKYDNVAAAFTGVNNSITNIHNEINKEIGKVVSDSLVKQDKEGDPITIGKETGGTIINLQNKNNENRTISGVIGGTISKDSIEAINGSQLFETNEKVASYFGGGAKYEEGQWTAPTFTVKTVKDGGSDVEDKEYKTVAEALAGVGASITNVRKEINNEITNVVSDSLVKWDEDKQLIKIGAEKYGNKITISDNDGKNRTLSGVKDAEQDNDAVNKGQLDASLKELSTSLQSEDSAVVHYDKKEEGETDYTNITLGKGKGSTSVGLHNVADGKIIKDSHDVITGGQINKIGEDIAKFLGGASSFKDGALTVPTYEISNISDKGEVARSSYNDVGSAFAGLDSNIENVNNNLTNKFNEFTQNITNITQEVQGDALLWDKTKGAFVSTHGDNKENNKLTSLKNGDITAASSDAIAGNQLYSLGYSVAKTLGGNASYENGTWISPTFKFKSVSEDGTKVEDKDYSTIAEAFAGVGLSFENLQKEFTQSNTEVTDNIKQNALLWSDEDSAYVALHGQGGKRSKSKLKLLLDGDISEGSSDAITGNQLYSLNKTLAMYLGGGARYEG